jgi:hypothetical protein
LKRDSPVESANKPGTNRRRRDSPAERGAWQPRAAPRAANCVDMVEERSIAMSQHDPDAGNGGQSADENRPNRL